MQSKRYNNKDRKMSQSRKPGHNNNSRGGGDRVKMMRIKYLEKAKDALASGDRVTAEYYYQYADHYSRQMDYSEGPTHYHNNEVIPSSAPTIDEN